SSKAVSPDGSRVFVTGYSEGVSSGTDYATIAYDSQTGAPLWLQRYNSRANLADAATSVAVSPDGSEVFVTGYSAHTIVDTDYVTIAYDAATGTPLWLRRYKRPNGSDT